MADKIPPGPKLDALTAEKVFGWRSRIEPAMAAPTASRSSFPPQQSADPGMAR